MIQAEMKFVRQQKGSETKAATFVSLPALTCVLSPGRGTHTARVGKVRLPISPIQLEGLSGLKMARGTMQP